MADNKVYYYMRLKDNFFDTDEMLVLESLQDGHLYSNILLKLYLRSLRTNGKLMFNNTIPYNPQMIATITRHQIGTVERALKIFQEMSLVEILDSGAIYMLNIQNYVGQASTEADRKREYRARIEREKLLDKCPDIHTPEIKKEIETKTDIENICAEPLQVSPPEPEEPPVISFILNDKSRYPIRQAQVDEWSGLYPAVDIMQELRKMAGWLDANPSKRKTKRGILRFVNGWLAREQDKGGKKVENSGRNTAGTDEEHPGSGETYGKYGIWL